MFVDATYAYTTHKDEHKPCQLSTAAETKAVYMHCMIWILAYSFNNCPLPNAVEHVQMVLCTTGAELSSKYYPKNIKQK